MSGDLEELAEIFAALSDQYLMAQVASGDLTEAAQLVAERELRRRGIALPPDSGHALAEPPPEEDGPVDLVTVARFLLPTDAHILRGRLEAQGIPAVVADANLVQANNLISVAIGGVRVQVPAGFACAAADVVAAVGRGEFALRDGEAFDSEAR